MENQPQNSEFRNNPENFHPLKSQCFQDSLYIHTSLLHLSLGGFLPKFNFLLTRLRETAEKYNERKMIITAFKSPHSTEQ